MRYYDPITHSEPVAGINDLTGATAETAMPEASRAFFQREAKAGFMWAKDPSNPWPIEIPIPAASPAELRAIERAWAGRELFLTDPVLIADSPYTEQEQTQIRVYRTALRNPAREATTRYPDPSWRPVFPAGVKRPGD